MSTKAQKPAAQPQKMSAAQLIEQARLLEAEELVKAQKALESAEKRLATAREAVPEADKALEDALKGQDAEAVKTAFDKQIVAKKALASAEVSFEKAKAKARPASAPSQPAPTVQKTEPKEEKVVKTQRSTPRWLKWVGIAALVVIAGFVILYGTASIFTVWAARQPAAPANQQVLRDPIDRTVIEIAPAEVEAKAENPIAEDVEVAAEVPAVAPIVVEADQTFRFVGDVPAYSDFRSAVREPGDTAVFVWNFDSGLDGAVIRRIWPDDILVKATLLIPGQDAKDITSLFEMFFVSAGGTGDSNLDSVLQERGVNIADGEILMQNKNAIALGNIPAGSKLVFEIKDDADLAVNRGIGVVVDTFVDAFTVSIP